MKEISEVIARVRVHQPEVVSINEGEGTHTSILERKTARQDIGKTIGSHGQTAGRCRIVWYHA